MNFHSVAVKDTSCAIRLLTKFALPPEASQKTSLKLHHDSEYKFICYYLPIDRRADNQQVISGKLFFKRVSLRELFLCKLNVQAEIIMKNFESLLSQLSSNA